MKTFKLCVHNLQKNQDILLSPKEFPDVQVGDVVEIYHPDNEWNRLLLQVKCLPEDYQHKESLSVEQGIANSFSLRPYSNVIVNKVDPKNVSLDLVELLFKEQYFGRSDMWRLCKHLKNTCVHLKKVIEFTEMRAHVHELWAKGENVTCGVINEDTRVVFRSPTAVVQIFIQMSSEMWDFDLHGDLYFEKAVNGFLTDLFDKWKDQNCLHDVTIVLFSRTLYEAHSLEDFPPSVRQCLLIDSQGRIYEDFYRVIIQNERYEEWSSVLRQLRTLFNSYQDDVLHRHSRDQQGWRIPRAYNSVASQGNFLETLNMSLNLFENYYLDRNFDRTGKVSVVITPGPGVFEVDRMLANITKQRTIDCGVGSDLVCMGEQPLHAAPLFKFHSKCSNHSIEVGDDYNIPHWMNHSFYMSKNQIEDHLHSSFVPRIKPPPALLKELEGPMTVKKNLLPGKDDPSDNIPFVDYDEFDSQVFKLPLGTVARTYSVRGTSLPLGVTSRGPSTPKTWAEARQRLKPRRRHISDEVSAYLNGQTDKGTSPAISIPSQSPSHDDMSYSFCGYPIQETAISRGSFESTDSDELNSRPVVGSAGSPIGHSRNLHNHRPHRALINPFAPSRLQFKMTSNRRRWVHAFPVDQHGMQMQARHLQSVSHTDPPEYDFPWSTKEALQSPALTVTTSRKQRLQVTQNSASSHLDSVEHQNHGGESMSESPVSRQDPAMGVNRRNPSNSASHRHSQKILTGSKMKMFGRIKTETGQQWSSDMATGYDWRPLASDLQSDEGSRLTKSIFRGDIQSNTFMAGITVDWKSLTIPASLPVTTDYFPDRQSLQNDYVVSEYELLPEDVNAEIWSSWTRSMSEDKSLMVYRRPPMTAHEVFLELISQRLGQGFQLIIQNKSHQVTEQSKPSTASQTSGTGFIRFGAKAVDKVYYMSIGRIYHQVSLSEHKHKAQVTRYSPRHPQPQLHQHYRYRFQAPDSLSYDVSWTKFSNEKLENYNWNHLDQYICTQGDWDFGLIDPLKYWRSRFFLLPLNNPATKMIVEKESTRCDIYEEKTPAELHQLILGFVKFLENMNKLKRTNVQRKSKTDAAAATSGSGGESSPRKPDTDGSSEKEEKLNVTMTSLKLAEALVDPFHGLNLIQNQAGLPANTFISSEAVAWCCQNVMGVSTTLQAVALMQRLMDDQMVLHCSGNPRHKFIYGFYLYYIPQRLLTRPGQTHEPGAHPPTHLNILNAGHNCLFQNEWCEVTILPVHSLEVLDSGVNKDKNQKEKPIVGPSFYVPTEVPRKRSESMLVPELEDWRVLTGQNRQYWGQVPDQEVDPSRCNGCSIINRKYKATLLHKYVNMDVDVAHKSDRREMAIARYHAYYSPKCAFQLQLQWMVATGCILGDLVYTFARRASFCGFHLIPVPCDPFAQPCTENSDPLRGPIFVPLDMRPLGADLFLGCTSEERQEILYIIQDAIIKRFGFLPASVKVPEDPMCIQDEENYNHQYVHCTAGMFVLIPESNPTVTDLYHPPMGLSVSPNVASEISGLSKKSSSDDHKLYLAQQGRPESAPNEVGFLWSWNYMSSRRWRTPNTGDERFQDTMLADFRSFCSNQDNRLCTFWQGFRGVVGL